MPNNGQRTIATPAAAMLAAIVLLAGCETVPDHDRQTVSRSSCLSTRYATTCRATGAGGVKSTLRCQHGGGLTTCQSETTRRKP